MTVSFKPPAIPLRALDALDWAPRFGKLPEKFYTRLAPTPLPEPYLVAFNPDAAPLIGLAPGEESRADFASFFTGNQAFAGSSPLAAVYSGHQFGVYVPQLGDGRAISLGEVVGSAGACEIQLKGAGRTPYSRSGDGRAVLRSSIREYLCSEAMHGLGIATTRALAITGSDQPVIRETVETAAVVTRLAPSLVRFGSFEFWYHRRDAEAVRQLADYVIREFYPEFEGAEDRYPLFLREVVRRTARMIAQWQAVGFMHGVMNTDNMSILGLTLDYGPFGFMEAFEPGHICNHTDEGGRYAYNMQPQVGLWNLYALGQALVPLMEPEIIEAELKTYDAQFDEVMNGMLRAKLGLASPHDDDHLLVNELFGLMAESHADYTLFFRTLSGLHAADAAGDAPLRDLVINRERFDAWAVSYRRRLTLENSVDAQRSVLMNANNPKYVLRNYLAEVAIRKARDERDYSEIENLRKLLSRPYDEQPENAHYAALPPDWASGLEVSCSS
ncbi:MAG: hypothetical protein JWN73_3147 [Betaproteobacteria bacterium]|nr:hypothetical protein [Betaproteobacteria bacterium]